MKKITLLFILFCLPKLLAQTAFVSAGGNAVGAGGSSSYSIGQVAYTNHVGGNGTIALGIQQPAEIFTLGNDDFPEITLQMSVYPNPTTAFLNLTIPEYSSETINYQLLDMKGSVVQSQKVSQKETQISLENMQAAIYFLKISDNNRVIKTFKIIKKAP